MLTIVKGRASPRPVVRVTMEGPGELTRLCVVEEDYLIEAVALEDRVLYSPGEYSALGRFEPGDIIRVMLVWDGEGEPNVPTIHVAWRRALWSKPEITVDALTSWAKDAYPWVDLAPLLEELPEDWMAVTVEEFRRFQVRVALAAVETRETSLTELAESNLVETRSVESEAQGASDEP